MTQQRLADGTASFLILVGKHESREAVVADASELLRSLLGDAPRRQAADRAAPVDYADAMRRVEAEVYDSE